MRRPTPTFTLVALLVAGALILALRDDALAQQAPRMISSYVQQLPSDPDSPVWDQIKATTVPLTPQAVSLPRLSQVSVSTVAVRSLNDGQRIAFLLEWADPTRDAHAIRPDQFRDAAAVMLAVDEGLPNICMGMPGQVTNLWHWKADWQEDIDKGFQDVVDAYPNFFKDAYPFAAGTPPFRAPADFGSAEARQYLIGLAAGNPLARPDRSSPVEEMLSVGFGTATHKAQQAVQGKGVWSNGTWRVVFSRPLAATDPDSARLDGRTDAPVAFAVWNGSNQEVGARKQLSSFVTVRIAGAPPPPIAPIPQQPPAPPTAWWWYLLGAAAIIIPAVAGLVGWWGWKADVARSQDRQR